MRFSSFTQKALSAFLSLFFFTQCALANAPEANFWAERQKSVEKSRKESSQSLLAVGVSGEASSSLLQVLHRLPDVDGRSPIPALSKRLAKSLPEDFTRNNANLLSALPYPYSNLQNISLPQGVPSGAVVIHIQDVHMNADAQKNIGRAVQELINKDAVGLVALEGSFDPINVKPYQAFPDREAIRLAADYLLQENQISGPIHAAMTSPRETPPILGVDDPDDYRANVEAYQKSAVFMKEYRKKNDLLINQIQKQKTTIFTPALLAFDDEVQSYRSGKTTLGQYLQFLETISPPSTEVRKFLKALAMESTLDFKRVETERTRLLQRLGLKLNKDQTAELLNQSVAYHIGRIHYADFYGYLHNLCATNAIDLADYPAMDVYIRYVLLADEINAEELSRETAALEDAGYDRLAGTVFEKSLVERSRHLHLIGKLLEFSLTSDEWKKYQETKKKEAVDLRSFENFYKRAEARDADMARNLLKEMGMRKVSVSVLVSGGFHSSGVDSLLRRAGVTVITLAPKIEKVDTPQGADYLGVFTREKTPLEEIFRGEKLFLAQNPTEGITGSGAAGFLTVAVSEHGGHPEMFGLSTSDQERFRQVAPRAAKKISVQADQVGDKIDLRITYHGRGGRKTTRMIVALAPDRADIQSMTLVPSAPVSSLAMFRMNFLQFFRLVPLILRGRGYIQKLIQRDKNIGMMDAVKWAVGLEKIREAVIRGTRVGGGVGIVFETTVLLSSVFLFHAADIPLTVIFFLVAFLCLGSGVLVNVPLRFRLWLLSPPPAVGVPPYTVDGLPEALQRRGYWAIRDFSTGGSAASTFLALDSYGRRVVVKYADWEGIGGNGMPWLSRQAHRLCELRMSLPFESALLFPEVTDFQETSDYVFYAMHYFPGAEPITELFLRNPATIAQDLIRIFGLLYQHLYSKGGVPAPDQYVTEAHMRRLYYRVGLLILREGAVYDQLLRDQPIQIGSAAYSDITYLFEALFLHDEVRINGRVYHNLPRLMDILTQNLDYLNERLSPATLPLYYHGDLLLRNVLGMAEDLLRLIDIRGRDVNQMTPSNISIEYELAKIAHSLLFEPIRCDLFEIDVRLETGLPEILLQMQDSPVVNAYLDARRRFAELLGNHPGLQEIMEQGGRTDWLGHLWLAEAIHFATDAVNRMSQDSTGRHALAYVVISIVLLEDFLIAHELLEPPLGYVDPLQALSSNQAAPAEAQWDADLRKSATDIVTIIIATAVLSAFGLWMGLGFWWTFFVWVPIALSIGFAAHEGGHALEDILWRHVKPRLKFDRGGVFPGFGWRFHVPGSHGWSGIAGNLIALSLTPLLWLTPLPTPAIAMIIIAGVIFSLGVTDWADMRIQKRASREADSVIETVEAIQKAYAGGTLTEQAALDYVDRELLSKMPMPVGLRQFSSLNELSRGLAGQSIDVTNKEALGRFLAEALLGSNGQICFVDDKTVDDWMPFVALLKAYLPNDQYLIVASNAAVAERFRVPELDMPPDSVAVAAEAFVDEEGREYIRLRTVESLIRNHPRLLNSPSLTLHYVSGAVELDESGVTLPALRSAAEAFRRIQAALGGIPLKMQLEIIDDIVKVLQTAA